MEENKTGKLFEKLCATIAFLRDPNKGCPWDIKQTHTSLKPYIIEEAYELNDAIDENSDQIKNELGDVLLQVMLHAQIAADEKTFTINEVIELLNAKLIERHPHVFGDKKCQSAEEVATTWTRAKQQLSGASILGSISRALPALQKARLLGARASTVGFDWASANEVLGKIDEEVKECKQAILNKSDKEIQEEIGDLLFAIAQLARKLEADPEDILHKACDKFSKRFQAMETQAARDLSKLSATELEALWQSVKMKK